MSQASEQITEQFKKYSPKTPWYTRFEIDQKLAGADTTVIYENFIVTSADNGDGTFSYTNDAGAMKTGIRSAEGYQTFTLQKGVYTLGQNKISAIINDTLHRSEAGGGLREDASNSVTLTAPVGSGTEVTIIYFKTLFNSTTTGKLPYVSSIEPASVEVSYGFLWVDMRE